MPKAADDKRTALFPFTYARKYCAEPSMSCVRRSQKPKASRAALGASPSSARRLTQPCAVPQLSHRTTSSRPNEGSTSLHAGPSQIASASA